MTRATTHLEQLERFLLGDLLEVDDILLLGVHLDGGVSCVAGGMARVKGHRAARHPSRATALPPRSPWRQGDGPEPAMHTSRGGDASKRPLAPLVAIVELRSG